MGTGVDTDNLVHVQPKQARPRRRSHRTDSSSSFVSRLACACAPAKEVSPWCYQVRPLRRDQDALRSTTFFRLLCPPVRPVLERKDCAEAARLQPCLSTTRRTTRSCCSFDTRVPYAVRDTANKTESDNGGNLHHQLLTALRSLDFLAGGLAASGGVNSHPRGALGVPSWLVTHVHIPTQCDILNTC